MSGVKLHHLKLLCVVICALLAGGQAMSQTVTGTISGTVVDSSGLVIAGATATLINERTGDSRSTAIPLHLSRFLAHKTRRG